MGQVEFFWKAIYEDHTSILQKDGKKFADIDQSRLIAIEVYNLQDQLVLVVPFPKGADLIIFYRGYVSHTIGVKGQRHVVEHFFGYKMEGYELKASKGQEDRAIKFIARILPNGVILLQNHADRDELLIPKTNG